MSWFHANTLDSDSWKSLLGIAWKIKKHIILDWTSWLSLMFSPHVIFPLDDNRWSIDHRRLRSDCRFKKLKLRSRCLSWFGWAALEPMCRGRIILYIYICLPIIICMYTCAYYIYILYIYNYIYITIYITIYIYTYELQLFVQLSHWLCREVQARPCMQSFPLVTSIGSSHCGDCHLWTTSASRRQMCVNLRKRQVRFKDSMKVSSSSSSSSYIYIYIQIYMCVYMVSSIWNHHRLKLCRKKPVLFSSVVQHNAFAFAAMDPFRFPPLRVAPWCREGHGAAMGAVARRWGWMGMDGDGRSSWIPKWEIYHGIIDI